MNEIMSGAATPAQIAGFLMALRAKGETVEEMRGIADQMLAHANRITVPGVSLDVVGTGGDRAHTVNISTMAAMVCAGGWGAGRQARQPGGVVVLGFGRRARGAGVDLRARPVAGRGGRRGGGHHLLLRAGVPPGASGTPAASDASSGCATAFNFLGPLTNPAQPTYAAVGVADARMAPIVAGVFASRGRDAAVFRGDDGLDELTLATTSSVWWVRAGSVTSRVVDPVRLGLSLQPTSALRGGDPAYNAGVVRSMFGGEPGPVRDAVLLNAGLALALTGTDSGSSADEFEADVRAGMARAT